MFYDIADPYENAYTRSVYVRNLNDRIRIIVEKIKEGKRDPLVRKLAADAVRNVAPRDWLGEVAAIFEFVRQNVRYTLDVHGLDTYQRARRTLQLGIGDCLAGDTEIILRNKKTGLYEIKAIADLRGCWSDYQVLSYDFESGKWTFQDILLWVDKGERPVYHVKLYNGWSFRCTDDHKFFTYEGQKNREICVRRLYEIDLTRAWKRRVVSALKIPSLDLDIGVDDDLLWLIGFYVAEGWKDKTGKVCIAQDCPLVLWEIKSKVERMGGSARVSKREKHSYVEIHSGPLRDVLSECGSNAFEKALPWWCLSLPREKIEIILNSYIRGDSFVPRRGRWLETAKVIHNTSSDMLAKQLKLIHMILGLPLSAYYQINHGGAGRRPIWRLIQRRGRQKANNFEIMPGITYNTIRSVEPAGVQKVYDIMVAKTHNFVLANGLIVHNCDDQVILLGAMLQSIGYPIALKVIESVDSTHGWNHIYLLVGVPPSAPQRWIPLDPTVSQPMGWELPPQYVRRSAIYYVD